MDTLISFLALTIFPGGLFILVAGLAYEWANRKILAQFQNRIGPRWFQPFADVVKLFVKEEVVPDGVNKTLFIGLPILALAGVLTAALYVPIAGLLPSYSFNGDLIVTIYLLSLVTLCMGLAGSNTRDRFSLVGATRTLTQLFSYEAPFSAGPSGTGRCGGVLADQRHPVVLERTLADPHPTPGFHRGDHRLDGQAGAGALRRPGS